MKRSFAALVACALALATALAQPRPLPADPILILISLDGWRWDYVDRVAAPNLKALAARGVRARELIPVFPTLTFPNHYTIVTGLYPAHHGIVSNEMADPDIADRFAPSAATAKEARWWGGEPIWVTAIRQGRRAASMFWPGAEAAIGGVRPTYWRPFDDSFPNEKRVAQVLDWLRLPDDQRPSFISLYFSDTDHAGHEYGPLSPQLREAAARVDARVGDLVGGVQRTGFADRTTFVIVSDHGMTPVVERVFLDDYIDLNTIDVIQWDELLQIAPRTGVSVDTVYEQMRTRIPHVDIYRKRDIPAELRYRDNPRIPPILGIPRKGWIVTSHAREGSRALAPRPPLRGAHGYDPAVRDMHALFVAAGPTVRRGLVVAPFENIHVYEFLCAVLHLTPAKNDGDPAVTSPFLSR